MNKSTLIDAVAKTAEIKKVDAEKAVNAVFAALEGALAAGDKVQLAGFGSFTVKERKERTGRNPRTKETIVIPASKTLGFAPAKALKDAINK